MFFIKLFTFVVLLFICSVSLFSQDQIESLDKVSDVSFKYDLQAKVGQSKQSAKNIASYLCGAGLAVSLIVVIKESLKINGNARQYIIGWVVALITYLIAINIF